MARSGHGWILAVTLAALAGPLAAQRRRLDPAPVLRIGRAESEESRMLTTVVGATRRADGHSLVGDRGDWNLLHFDSKGQLVRRLARKGKGPGEIEFHAFMWRCGDAVYTDDIDGYRISVFSLDGTVQRTFRFGSPTAGEPPYRSACNADARFVHNGWGKEDRTRGLDRAQRTSAPYWLSRADSAVGPVLGHAHRRVGAPAVPDGAAALSRAGGGRRRLALGTGLSACVRPHGGVDGVRPHRHAARHGRHAARPRTIRDRARPRAGALRGSRRGRPRGADVPPAAGSVTPR